jgi:hypothetical protein
VVSGAQDGKWPAAFEPAVDLDEDGSQDIDGADEVVCGDRSAAVEDPP